MVSSSFSSFNGEECHFARFTNNEGTPRQTNLLESALNKKSNLLKKVDDISKCTNSYVEPTGMCSTQDEGC
jgi:hypothetical protein